MTFNGSTSLKYVYIADDDEDDRSFLSDAILEIEPTVQLKEALDGCHLLDILTGLSAPLPDIIFLDINMPKMDGFQCLEQIRKAEGALKDVKIIMFSTSSDPDNIERALLLGADFYAVKPNSYNLLKSFLLDVLKADWHTAGNSHIKFRIL